MPCGKMVEIFFQTSSHISSVVNHGVWSLETCIGVDGHEYFKVECQRHVKQQL